MNIKISYSNCGRGYAFGNPTLSINQARFNFPRRPGSEYIALCGANEKIVSWFESGKFREALLGHNEFFIPDPGSRDNHDYVLVTYVLLNWVDQSGRSAEICKRLENVFVDIALNSPIELLDILLAYAINARDLKMRSFVDTSIILELLQKELSCKHSAAPPSMGLKFDERLADLRVRFSKLEHKNGEAARKAE